MATQKNSKREKQVGTKERIMMVSKKLMHDKDFDDVTVKEIADMADIERRTFYRYFSDKYELLFCTFQFYFGDVFKPEAPVENFEAYLEAIAEVVRDNHRFFASAFKSNHGQNNFNDWFVAFMMPFLSERLPTNLFTPGEKGRFVRYLCYFMIDECRGWLARDDYCSPPTFAAHIVACFKAVASAILEH